MLVGWVGKERRKRRRKDDEGKKGRAMSEQMIGVASSWLQAGGVKGLMGIRLVEVSR